MSESQFNIISLQKSLLSLRPRARLDVLLNTPNTLTVVRQLPAQDLFITLKEVGLSDSLEILELVSPEQFQTFLDLDTWHHGRLDPIAMGDWLKAMASANPNRAVQVFRELDVELVSLLLKMYAQVFDISAEEEPQEMGLVHSITPDGRYIVVLNAEKSEENIVYFLKEALEQLYQRDFSFAQRLIENVRWETISILEEEALKWRDGRMQDMGFAPFSEEKDILAYIEPTAKSHIPAPNIHASDQPNTSVLLHEIKSNRFFYQALSNASEELKQRVLNELVTTANRVHVAMGSDLGDTKALFDTVTHALNTIETAMAYLSKGDNIQLQYVLAQNTMLRLFQIGHSLALKIGRDFRKVILDPNAGLSGSGLLRLDSPLAEVAAGVLLTEPMYYAGLSDSKKIDYRRFENLNDVGRTAAAIAESIFRSYLIGPKGIGVAEDKLRTIELDDKANLPTHSVLLATWLCHQLLGGNPSVLPLEQSQVEQLWDKVHATPDSFKLTQEDMNTCISLVGKIAKDLVPSPSMKTIEEAQLRALNYVQLVMNSVSSEFALITNKPIDLGLIASVRVAQTAIAKSTSHKNASSILQPKKNRI
jgi:Family of unknown function (DUF6178)